MNITYEYDLLASVIPSDANENVLISLSAGEELINCEVRAVSIDGASHLIKIGIDTDLDSAADIWLEFNTSVESGIPISCVIRGLAGAKKITVRTADADDVHFSLLGCKKTTT